MNTERARARVCVCVHVRVRVRVRVRVNWRVPEWTAKNLKLLSPKSLHIGSQSELSLWA